MLHLFFNRKCRCSRRVVCCEQIKFFSALQVPQSQRLVLGGRDRTASVRRDRDPGHPIALAFERVAFPEKSTDAGVRRVLPVPKSQSRSVLSQDADAGSLLFPWKVQNRLLRVPRNVELHIC
jgi:hypothetical protein